MFTLVVYFFNLYIFLQRSFHWRNKNDSKFVELGYLEFCLFYYSNACSIHWCFYTHSFFIKRPSLWTFYGTNILVYGLLYKSTMVYCAKRFASYSWWKSLIYIVGDKYFNFSNIFNNNYCFLLLSTIIEKGNLSNPRNNHITIRSIAGRWGSCFKCNFAWQKKRS